MEDECSGSESSAAAFCSRLRYLPACGQSVRPPEAQRILGGVVWTWALKGGQVTAESSGGRERCCLKHTPEDTVETSGG